jgi:LemA protein
MEYALILLVFVVVLGFWLVVTYNRLVRARIRIDEAWAQIDTQLQRRHDLIPNIVETVKGYAAHERETLDAVISARTRAVSAEGVQDLADAENMLTQTLGRLFALSENYPDLKADANFRQLAEELRHTENMVAGARQHYNAAVRTYEQSRQVFMASEGAEGTPPAASREPTVWITTYSVRDAEVSLR